MPLGLSIEVGDRMSCPALKASAYADPGEAERESVDVMFGCVVSTSVNASCVGYRYCC
jgi:hypothetical protein